MRKAKTLPATILPADTELTCMYCERKATKIFEGSLTYCDECLKAAYAGTRTPSPQENTPPQSVKVSVKVQARKQLTVARKDVQNLYRQMQGCPYLCYLYAESQDDESFLKQFEKDLPLWKDCFCYLGKKLLGLIDTADQCEAACRETGAKVPEWPYCSMQGIREWLQQFDITSPTAKPKPVQTPEVSQPFEREPNANDAHHMRGMGIRWD
jgi:hypothetical protein